MNPNLRPEKTTSYEIGFKQMLGENASLQLSAFYKEIEDQIQVLSIKKLESDLDVAKAKVRLRL
jgi:outer membrane receptor protein involved in Fe transport